MKPAKGKPAPGGNRETGAFDTAAACNFSTIRIMRHLILTVPFECAALIFLLLLVAFTAAGVQS